MPMVDAGALVRECRRRAGLAQRELAARAGLSVRALRDIEQGRVRRPRMGSVQRLVDALNLTRLERGALHDAFGGDGTHRPAGAGGATRIDVLGPLVLRRGAATLGIEQSMPRALLCLLALHAGESVPVTAVIDALWDDDPPATCRNLVQVYIGRLRRLLEPGRKPRASGQAIRLTPAGYVLDPATALIDVVRFDELVRQATRAAETGDAALAAARYLEALRCWRGPVLADAEPRLRDHPAVVRLAQRRVDAGLAHADLALAAGRPVDTLGQLRDLAAAEPLHEGIHARLIHALAGTGEQAAALRAYEGLRRRLDEQLGVAPGAEAVAAHRRILHGGAARPAPTPAGPASDVEEPAGPAQLPAAVTAFTGREVALRDLDRLLAYEEPGVPVPIVAITGAGGVGKTALAVHWAHRVRDGFVDGQLYMNLRGYAPGAPVHPVAALARFLNALGVRPDRVPVDVDTAAEAFRTRVAGRRMLILLDNARDAEQVRPLLPGVPGCVVVVTSRDALGGLVALDGARRMPLEVLTPAESRALLQTLLGAGRVRAAEHAASELAELCGHLPLALRLAAANLISGATHRLSAYAASLRADNRLGALAVAGDPQAAVRATFDLSYAGCGDTDRLVFRRLGLLPGPDVTAPAAAALTELDVGTAASALNRLAAAHLVDEHAPGRYGLHDLMRHYAAERSARDDPASQREAAVARLHELYLANTDAAARQLYPQTTRLPTQSRLATEVSDQASASAWLDAERANLVATAIRAAEHGPYEVAWTLADTLRGYLFFFRMSTVDWLAVAGAGLAAARADGQPAAEAAAHVSLAGLAGFTGRHREAAESYARALAAAERAGWVECQATVLGHLGTIHADRGRLDDAVTHLRRALDLNQHTGHDAGVEINLCNLGVLSTQLGRLADAIDYLARALTLTRRLGHRAAEAIALAALGEAYHLRGDADQAATHATAGLALHREVGNRGNEADAMRTVANLHRDRGEHDRALALARDAVQLAEQTGHRLVEADVRTVLASIHCTCGEAAEAVRQFTRVLAIAESADYRYAQVQALIGLAAAHLALGRPHAATGPAEHALALAKEAGYRLHEGRAITELATAHLALDHRRTGDGYAAQALAVHAETGHQPGHEQTIALIARYASAAQ